MALIESKGLSEAKTHLSQLMTAVVHGRQPLIVDRYRGRERMLLLGPTDYAPLLDHFRFETKTSFADGEWTLFSPELNLVVGGEDFDAALDELVVLAEEFAADFAARKDFYMQTDRARTLPWLLRLAVTEPEQRRHLFIEPPRQTSPTS